MSRGPPALALVQYTTAIHRVLMDECNGDWSDPRVEQALIVSDSEYVHSLYGDGPISRQKEVTCIQNMRTRLRNQYCVLLRLRERRRATGGVPPHD